jgi:hypothetical protein
MAKKTFDTLPKPVQRELNNFRRQELTGDPYNVGLDVDDVYAVYRAFLELIELHDKQEDEITERFMKAVESQETFAPFFREYQKAQTNSKDVDEKAVEKSEKTPRKKAEN